MKDLPFDLAYIIDQFNIPGVFSGFKIQSNGNINKTYLIYFENDGKTDKYTLQSINTFVFNKPYELMQNIASVTNHIHSKLIQKGLDPQRRVLSFMPSADGNYCCEDENGTFWRLYHYIDNVYTLNTIRDSSVFEACGKAFGEFQNLLSDFDGKKLFETIENFHNTAARLDQLQEAIKEDAAGRVKSLSDEINFVMARKDDAHLLVDSINENKLPIRVTHNDTKLNNILFDNETNEGICIIDLDTVMPGLSLYDFGDSIRYGANKVVEDDPDISKVGIDLTLYESFTKGYLASCGDSLTDLEKDLLPFSVKLMALELGIRFLTDYINGDKYFKINNPLHNLNRCHNQLALVKDIEKNMESLNKITKRIIK